MGPSKGGVMAITLCPQCKEYLARCDIYKYCCYCGWPYDKTKLIEVKSDGPEWNPVEMGRLRFTKGGEKDERRNK
jgi:hypothetical protein